MIEDFSGDDVRLLSELGFVGIGRGMSTQATTIFTFVRSARPSLEVGYIGGAMALLIEGKVSLADEMLRAAPQSEAVIAFRAVVLRRLGDVSMAKELKDDLVAMRASEAVINIATAAADER